MTAILNEIRSELEKNADQTVRESGEKFFKEGVKLYGLRNSDVHSMSRNYYRKLPEKGKKAIFILCEDLWRSGYNEEAFIACNWSYTVRKQFTPDDMIIFEKWVDNYITNWATCDTFCNHTVGEIIMKYPGCVENLKKWAISTNRWLRRGSAVSLIIPARKGLFLNDILEIATILLTDSDDMVQKGYGWMLKAASEVHTDKVYDFVTGNCKTMPRTAFRYAIEKMPAGMRTSAMKKK